MTRWYRGPEVILLQQKQDTLAAVDMWSIGAIFAELLQMQQENRPDPTKRGPIFPGDSCFPLSIKDQMDYASRVDQMQVIFDVIGSPTAEEIAKITGLLLRCHCVSQVKVFLVTLCECQMKRQESI